MASIYLIRHGQASFGKKNYDQLSELGEAQARVLGKALSERIGTIDKVYAGSMLRHEQTMTRCLRNFNGGSDQFKPIFDQGWNEYDHEEVLLKHRPEMTSMNELMAHLEKQSDAKAAFKQYFSEAIARWMSGDHDQDYTESWLEFTQRVNSALQGVKDGLGDAQNTLVFTSGGPISVLSQSLLLVPQEKLMSLNWTLVNCGVTKLVMTSSDLFLASLNEHTHFEGDENKHLITYT